MTKIEWTDMTWNPTTGCTPVSAGCDNCYAKVMHRRLRGMQNEKYMGLFNIPRCWPKELERNFGKKPKKIFVNSMGDLFHDEIPFHFINEIMIVIERHPQHIFQILTKRPHRMRHYFYGIDVPENLWLGVTVENKKHLYRIDYLKKIPATVKFISFEPLLEYIDIIDLEGIDWVIAGAETGPHTRFMSIGWAHSIMIQSYMLGVPFFFKKVSKGDFCPVDLMVRLFPWEK